MITEVTYPRPVLFKVLGGSRAWGLATVGSDTDQIIYYDSAPPDDMRSKMIPSRSKDLRLLPTQIIAPDVWYLGDFFSEEITVAPHFRPTLDKLLALRDRMVLASPMALYQNLSKKLNMYRRLYDEQGSGKYLMYLKFWYDWGRNVFSLGADACYNREDTSIYRTIRETESPGLDLVQPIIDDAISFTRTMPSPFGRPGDQTIFTDVSRIVSDYYKEYPASYE